MFLTGTIFFFSVLQSLSLYNPSGALAPAPFTQGSLWICANIVGKSHTVGGGGCRFAATHILPPDVKLLFLFRHQSPCPLFFAGRRRKEKLTKETPFSKGNFLKKVSSGLLQKLLGIRCRDVWCVSRRPEFSAFIPACANPFFKIFRGGVGEPFCKRLPRRVPFHSLIYLAAVSAAWVRASSGAAPCRIAAANPAKKLSPAPTVV